MAHPAEILWSHRRLSGSPGTWRRPCTCESADCFSTSYERQRTNSTAVECKWRCMHSRSHGLFGQHSDTSLESWDDELVMRGVDSGDNQDIKLLILEHLGEIGLWKGSARTVTCRTDKSCMMSSRATHRRILLGRRLAQLFEQTLMVLHSLRVDIT